MRLADQNAVDGHRRPSADAVSNQPWFGYISYLQLRLLTAGLNIYNHYILLLLLQLYNYITLL
jgi:hypothetical protein